MNSAYVPALVLNGKHLADHVWPKYGTHAFPNACQHVACFLMSTVFSPVVSPVVVPRPVPFLVAR